MMGWLLRNKSTATKTLLLDYDEEIEIAPEQVADVNPRYAREAIKADPETWERVTSADSAYVPAGER